VTLVVYTLPDQRSLHRNAARRLLQSAGGRRLQSCTWLLPREVAEQIWPRLDRIVARAGGELHAFTVQEEARV
jgi:hypothetical protein